MCICEINIKSITQGRLLAKKLKKYENDVIPIKRIFGEYSTSEPRLEDYRYRLDIELEEDLPNGTLTTLMINPSKTLPGEHPTIDPTVKNVIRIAYYCGYSKVVVLNCIPLIQPDLNKVKQRLNQDISSTEYSKNYKTIYSYIKKWCNDLLLAFGKDKQIWNNNKYSYSKVISANSSNSDLRLVFYRTNKDGTPSHPGRQCWKKLQEFYESHTQNKRLDELTDLSWLDSSHQF